MADNGRLVIMAMGLRAAAPDVWQGFLQAMDDYANDATMAMTTAPIDMLPRAQGMALAARDIARLLADAPVLHDKMQAAKLGKRHV